MSNNIQVEFKNGKLVLTVDVSEKTYKSAGMSNSGKNKLLATTGGTMYPENAPAHLKSLGIGLNVYAK